MAPGCCSAAGRAMQVKSLQGWGMYQSARFSSLHLAQKFASAWCSFAELSTCLRDCTLHAAGYCALAGCDCLPTWTYTSFTTGQTYNITNGTCQNPGGDWSTDWCYVNPLSCAHRPFLANGPTVTQAWDTCTAPNLNKTIDSGARPSTRQMAVMGVVWRPVRAVLRLVHTCTRACAV